MKGWVETDRRFRLTEAQARELARQFGTPLYVIDEHHFRARIREYRTAAKAAHPKGEIAFASKANSTLAVLKIAYQEGCTIDVASEGELRAAMAAGVPASACHLHGNNKQRQELEFALDQGIDCVMVDHFGEIEVLAELAKARPGSRTRYALRLAPGVDPITHAKISTGQADTKFGFNIADGSAERATLRMLELGLPLIGYHCHVGSQLLDPEAQRGGGEFLAKLAVEMHQKHGFEIEYLNVGGGLGAVYTSTDRPMAIAEYCKLIANAVNEALRGSGLDPVLAQEPGRSLIAESGVTLYQVGVIKTVPIKDGTRTFVAVDGGLSDNPRPALYGSKYTVERVASAVDRTWEYITDGPGAVISNPIPPDRTFTISGRHCETDKLFPDVELPEDLAVGDLLQVLSTGAYNSSMASNYNRYPRPATALIRESGEAVLIQRRDTWDEMLAREIVPEGLI